MNYIDYIPQFNPLMQQLNSYKKIIYNAANCKNKKFICKTFPKFYIPSKNVMLVPLKKSIFHNDVICVSIY